MCGFFLTNDSFDKERLEAILDARLAFRGPDAQSGVLSVNGWSVYHARLAIIATEEQFSQPYIGADNSCLLFNGELLNYKALAAKYNIEPATSDTHVLSSLLDRGLKDFSELEGFFAFAYIDANGALRHCVRDRFGVKPLYVAKNHQKISICSEASVLSDLYNLPYSEDALYEYRIFRAPIFSGSYFEGVTEVPVGTCLINGKYFDSVDYAGPPYLPIDQIHTSLNQTLVQGIQSRMISDVPVALLYSGGVDSNLIHQRVPSSIMRLTGGDVSSYDMQHAASQTSHHIRTVIVNDNDFRNRLAEMIKLRKEPVSVPNEVILSFLAEAWAGEGGKVLLSGEAADELFAGYDRIFFWAAKADGFDIDDFLDQYSYCSLAQISHPIKAKALRFFTDLGDLSVFEKVRQFFIKKHLPVLFRRLDFALMYSGVEGREPFAATEIFRLAMKISPEDLFDGAVGKAPLRKLLADSMGKEFAYRPKVGFPIDTSRIFTGVESKDRWANYAAWVNANLGKLN